MAKDTPKPGGVDDDGETTGTDLPVNEPNRQIKRWGCSAQPFLIILYNL